MVYLAPTPAARNLIKSYYSLTRILLPPLSSLVLQSPPTMLSLNLNEWGEEIFGRQFTSIKKTIVDDYLFTTT